MTKYNVGNSVVVKLKSSDAYCMNLLTKNEAKPGELECYARVTSTSDPRWWDERAKFSTRNVKFYGKVISIKEGTYNDNKTPYREVWVEFPFSKAMSPPVVILIFQYSLPLFSSKVRQSPPPSALTFKGDKPSSTTGLFILIFCALNLFTGASRRAFST